MSELLLDPLVSEIALSLCAGVASPFSHEVAKLIEKREWDSVARLRVNPHHYSDPERYWGDSVVAGFLRKLVDLPTTIDRKAVAVENFWKSELRCYRTNQRLLRYIHGTSVDPDEHVHGVLRRARMHIRRVLGKAPERDDVRGRFGPGATFSDRGVYTTIPDKMSSAPTLTDDAASWAPYWASTAWAKCSTVLSREPVFVRGNRFTTVPKDCTKDRGIAVEPGVNLFFQLGLGRIIRSRLRKAGIDLTDGQEKHRRKAKWASIHRTHATLDLSNASDTLCWSLVKLLLPEDWYALLMSVRSPMTLINGKWVLLEKFSSMGNGFTFELETLVFLGLILAVCPEGRYAPRVGHDVLVYGDDMIVPTGFSRVVISVLEFFGFEINKEKSFVDGPFRESCGGDYFAGVDVRPFHLKESPSEPQQLISLANGLKRLCNGEVGRSAATVGAWFSVVGSLPTSVRACRGPQDLGDLVVHDEPSHWQFKWENGIRYFRCYAPVHNRVIGWKGFAEEVVLAAALYGVGSGGERESVRHRDVLSTAADGSVMLSPKVSWGDTGVAPRDAVTGYRTTWVPCS